MAPLARGGPQYSQAPAIVTAAAVASLRDSSPVSPSYGCSTGEMTPLPLGFGDTIENLVLVQG